MNFFETYFKLTISVNFIYKFENDYKIKHQIIFQKSLIFLVLYFQTSGCLSSVGIYFIYFSHVVHFFLQNCVTVQSRGIFMTLLKSTINLVV